ncbi:DUF305 domain-containing protein [Isoptericola hypogeus]|uniref:DUF305 domain-containing protein n=1 Tax=Isoptericola hypogeus TaxID=300179 RepID=A0ABP4VFN1_9MICO
MPHTLMKRALVPALSLAVVAGLTACSDAEDAGHDMDAMTSPTSAQSSEPPAEDSASFNDADVTFAQMMIPHHEQAIAMSDVLLAKDGIDPEVVDLARQIKAAQGPEIDTLTRWLDAWGVEPTSGGHGSMDGMMSEEDVQALEEAQEAEAQRLFLKQMIVHHEGAVEMARAEVADGRDPQAVAMAQSVVDTQSDEIRAMEGLLAGG